MKREYEIFKDESYYDMWCVRDITDKDFNSRTSWHFDSHSQAFMFFNLIKEAK